MIFLLSLYYDIMLIVADAMNFKQKKSAQQKASAGRYKPYKSYYYYYC